MMKTRHIHMMSAFVAISCAVSCSHEDSLTLGPDCAGSGRKVCFAPTVSAISPLTKGVLINNNYGDTTIPFDESSTFYVASWDTPAGGDTTTFIPAFTTVKHYSGEISAEDHVNFTGWCTADSDGKAVEYIWKQGCKKVFYAYANLPSSGTSVTVTADSMTVSHTVPADPAAQTDILVGCYCGTGESNVGTESSPVMKNTGSATIAFDHPLAAVCLTMGAIVGTRSFSIKSIALEGVYSGGNVVLKPDGTISWSPAMDGTEPSTVTLSQTVSTTPDSESGEKVGDIFLVIPETFGTDSDARIRVEVVADGKDIKLYIPLSGEVWAAGHLYTYQVSYNGHEGIQLWENGPYWAAKNVGADYPEDYGWYFSWGNTDGYVTSNLSLRDPDVYYCNWIPSSGGSPVGQVFTMEYYTYAPGTSGGRLSSDIPATAANDAAFKYWGEKWRMPTKAEFDALLSNTDSREMTRNGHKGWLFTGKGDFSMRSIFLPSSGYGSDDLYSMGGKAATYWSGTRANTTGAYGLVWEGGSPASDIFPRFDGCSIRPVENVQ